jgi:N-acetylglucosamine-6-phosphate deacetylase
MLQCVKNFHIQCDIELGEAIRMCSLYPAKIMGLPYISGRLEINERADFICLDEKLNHIRIE